MELSDRATSLSPSLTLSIDSKAKAMKAEGIDVCGFAAGEPDFDTPDHIKQAAVAALEKPQEPSIEEALAALADVRSVVTSGRRMQGLAEAIALGFTELSRIPCFSLEGGQLRHGPMEMLSPEVGVVLFRSEDATVDLVTAMASSVVEAGAKLVVFDASARTPVPGAATIAFLPLTGLAAVFAMLPTAQRLMIAFAAARVTDAGTPVRSTKITRSE